MGWDPTDAFFQEELRKERRSLLWAEKVSLPPSYKVGRIGEIVLIFPKNKIDPQEFLNDLYKGYRFLIKVISPETPPPQMVILCLRSSESKLVLGRGISGLVFAFPLINGGGKKEKILWAALHEMGHHLMRGTSLKDSFSDWLLYFEASRRKIERIIKKSIFLEESFLESVVSEYFGFGQLYWLPSTAAEIRKDLSMEKSEYLLGAALFTFTRKRVECTPMELLNLLYKNLQENPSLSIYSLFDKILKSKGKGLRAMLKVEHEAQKMVRLLYAIFGEDY
jgi:hypothetical protein